MSEQATCGICGEPMPSGEEMFKFHGYSCACPKPALPNNLQQEASAMSWREVAVSAYRAYAASTGNKNFRGEPMPEFLQLPVAIRVAWEAAVRQVGDCLRIRANASHPDASRWAGWLPPQ